MRTFANYLGDAIWELPPLILHPFAGRDKSSDSLELPWLRGADEGRNPEELKRRELAAASTEIRMLFFLGKDLFRWMEQCQELAARIPELADANVRPQSFAGLLTGAPPRNVEEKLARWGVIGSSAILSRAIGLNAAFSGPPPDVLSVSFLSCYHRYADALFRCYMEMEPYCPISSANFHFRLYASGEYSRLLETQWRDSA